jgi:hypothetical protein
MGIQMNAVLSSFANRHFATIRVECAKNRSILFSGLWEVSNNSLERRTAVDQQRGREQVEQSKFSRD